MVTPLFNSNYTLLRLGLSRRKMQIIRIDETHQQKKRAIQVVSQTYRQSKENREQQQAVKRCNNL